MLRPNKSAQISHSTRIHSAVKAVGTIGGGDYTYTRDIGVTFYGLSADVTVIAAGLRGRG